MVTVTVLAKKVNMPMPAARVRRILAGAAKMIPRGRVHGAVAVVFVGDREMRALNNKYRRKNKTTDVLSFGETRRTVLRDDGGLSSPDEIGDIVISAQQARRQARAAGRSATDEVKELLVHGFLHLLGYDHEKPADARIMLPLQQRILKRLASSV